MKQTQHHASRIMPIRYGFTFLEFTVALVVFAIAMSGLVPLLSILSRDLQPWKTSAASVYKCTSPARDGNTNGTGLAYERHTWYLTADDDPWVRKLGAGARVTSSAAPSTPVPLESPVRSQDDDNGVIDADGDGLEDYAGEPGAGWEYNSGATSAVGGDQHRKVALPKGSPSTGVAVWNLKVTAAGWYSIQATWVDAADQATDAQFTVLKTSSPTSTLGTAIVNQSVAPAGVSDSSGRPWAPLTPVVQLAANDTVQVQLSDVRATSTAPETKYVVADAVRIVQNAVEIKSIERSLSGVNNNSSGADVTAKVSVMVNIPL